MGLTRVASKRRVRRVLRPDFEFLHHSTHGRQEKPNWRVHKKWIANSSFGERVSCPNVGLRAKNFSSSLEVLEVFRKVFLLGLCGLEHNLFTSGVPYFDTSLC